MEHHTVGEVADLATLSQLDEQVLLKELKVRYNNDKIYTYVGDILVAVNPFRDIGIYGKQYAEKYKLAKKENHAPHIFAVADGAYQSMLGTYAVRPKNQCILISGESGAGKTESTKLIIKQLVELCRGNTQLEQQILQVNPLLEAFGNAMTLMNDNSSRFGKYIQLKFCDGQVMGAKISEYLLEKSRVVRQAKREQNFHIFYFLFAGLTADQQTKFKLRTPKDYKYLNNGGACVKNNARLLKARYEELVNAMDMVGFTDEEQEDMFTVITGVLSMGNIEISANDNEEAVLKNTNRALGTVASLLGIDQQELTDCLTCIVNVTKGDVFRRNYTQAQAQDSRDAVAKMIYGRLFSWIVNKVNTLLAPRDNVDPAHIQEIGILDIFGFEHFDNNSFEQACINLANEQLQFFFNKHIFMLEQEEYKKEGINWQEIKFVDNQPLLELFLAKPIGIMSLLDEESQFPKGTDQSYVDKLNMRFSDNPNYVKSPHSQTCVFTIAHYAGNVMYDGTNWLEKNRDTLPPGTMQLLQQSRNQLLSLIFKGTISRTGTLSLQHRTTRMSKKSRRTKRVAHIAAKAAKERKLTVGAQFRNSLQMLMDKMVSSQPVFIRCIKPNHTKAPKTFDDKYVLEQLLYTGMLQTIKIRREGFAVRPTFAEFVEKYKILLLQPKLTADPQNCSYILKTTGLTGWQIGKTKVFLKYFHTDKLAERMDAMAKQAVHIQRIVRGFMDRQKVHRKRREAEEEAGRVEVFGNMVAALTISSMNNQSQALTNDKDIPKSFFHKTEERPVMVTPLDQFLPPKPGLPLNRQTAFGSADSASDSDDWSASDSDEVLEDDFQPVKTTGLTKFGEVGTKEASVQWFKQTQSMKLRMSTGSFAEWFHGIITRRRSEQLLQSKPVGCFLIRVSESRFGFTLSFRAEDRCRHYMIDQTPNGKYIIIGEPKVHRSLADMIDYLQKNKLSNWGGVLTVSCGQEAGTCDYSELVEGEEDLYSEVNTPEMQRKSVKMPLPHREQPPAEPVLPPAVPDRNRKATPVGSHEPKATIHPPKFNSNAKKQAFESLLRNQQAQEHAGIYGQATTLTPSRAKLPPRK